MVVVIVGEVTVDRHVHAGAQFPISFVQSRVWSCAVHIQRGSPQLKSCIKKSPQSLSEAFLPGDSRSPQVDNENWQLVLEMGLTVEEHVLLC